VSFERGSLDSSQSQQRLKVDLYRWTWGIDGRKRDEGTRKVNQCDEDLQEIVLD